MGTFQAQHFASKILGQLGICLRAMGILPNGKYGPPLRGEPDGAISTAPPASALTQAPAVADSLQLLLRWLTKTSSGEMRDNGRIAFAAFDTPLGQATNAWP